LNCGLIFIKYKGLSENDHRIVGGSWVDSS
jgi:hypothetical protein